MLHATLIAATLLLVYKKKNKLTGYKIMKQRFVQELEKSLVKNFVELCGGNPKLVDKLHWFNSHKLFLTPVASPPTSPKQSISYQNLPFFTHFNQLNQL
jgi:hypothetical protein